jgi:CRISPR-associated endonuclease Csn1
MKKILGLDLGTNSIGWALVSQDEKEKVGKIIDMGSRIIPMSQDVLGKFDSGVSVSQTAERTGFRGVRRLRERHLLRRERLHRVLNILGFLPEHYAAQIDFDKHFGQFLDEKEPKLAWKEIEKEGKTTFEFIFKKSFEEMLVDFSKHQPQLLEKNKKIPYDWTIYYLRKKALTEKIEKEELAWLLLNFNQKRGYYQLRGEDEEDINPNKLVEFHSLLVVDVTADEPQKGKDDIWYNIILENGWIYRRSSKNPLFDWKGKIREFIVTTDFNDDGTIKTDKEGKEKRSFRAPAETDWTLVKTKTEQTIDKSGKTVGQYIYDTLLQNPSQKINGKLVRVVERKFYREELKQILETQQKHHSELQNKELYNACLEELYEYNEAHRSNIVQRGFTYLFLNDIIFYQRPLKSKKSQISDCRYEERKDKNNIIHPVKCIAKSHPLFQEFRLWQWIKNLHIYKKENDESPVTTIFLTNEDDYVNLFDFLYNRKEITQEALIKYLLEPQKLRGKALSEEVSKYRWNFVEDKIYPCNETRSTIKSRLDKCTSVPIDFLTNEKEEALWHILYSVSDKNELEKALKRFAEKNSLGDDFVEQFKKFPPYKNEYGSYSAKAIKKLLPLMRMGKYWNEAVIDKKTKSRIEKIITGEVDEKIQTRVREKAINLTDISHFKGLPLWLACYVVYNRHSEGGDLQKWKTTADLGKYLKEFKQHSLRNPIVEQVITETLRVVKDIWQTYGEGQEDFFNEIHVELGREMKNPADKRKRITNQNTDNENTNLRIKALLIEMLNDREVENVNPYSPNQQEILKIYEDGVLNSDIEIPDDILKISKTAQPSQKELIRYKLWLEQKYRSPYTGEMIPLNKLFTSAYQIEHIIPQSRYFDDSFSNKVICEAEVNKLKDNQLGLEFIQNHEGEKVLLNFGKPVEILSETAYRDFVKKNYSYRDPKSKKLLLTDIPEAMIERQMNDTRYISKEVKNLLSKIVREEKEDDGTTSKNVLACNGQITTALKRDWGLNDIWNDIITPRFKRLNEMTNSNNFGKINSNTNKFLPEVPYEYQKGFQKKRIDHRHHAMDALAIACATRNHINYLNNQNALEKGKTKEQKQKSREDLRRLLCDKKYNQGEEGNYRWIFKAPWNNFTIDAKNKLSETIVSFKQNLRVINKTVNKYDKWQKDTNGQLKKVKATQEKGDSWAIRKPLHKAFVFGEINLSRVNVPKGKKIVAIRRSLDTSFDLKKIETITDTGIQKILRNYLQMKDNNPQIAFSPEGIEDMNNNISVYNEGKTHKPILKVRSFEVGSRFALGIKSNKKDKYVETADGTNLFFAIYERKDNKTRMFETISLSEVVEHQKQQNAYNVPTVDRTVIPIKKYLEYRGKAVEVVFLFHLSPNDLVYVPTEEERENAQIDWSNLDREQMKRIFNVNDFSSTCYFTPNSLAKNIVPKEVDLSFDRTKNKLSGSFDTKTASCDGVQIKDVCWKLQVDRLGKIKKVIR